MNVVGVSAKLQKGKSRSIGGKVKTQKSTNDDSVIKRPSTTKGSKKISTRKPMQLAQRMPECHIPDKENEVEDTVINPLRFFFHVVGT